MGFAGISSRLCAKSESDMAVAKIDAIGDGCDLRLPFPYSVDNFICRWSLGLGARMFFILPTGLTLTVLVARLEHETASAVWLRRW